MPEYLTPEPISVMVELGAGEVRIAAGDRADTVVEINPSDGADESDVHAAQQVRVDFSNGVLRVTGPKARLFDFSRKSRSVDVTIAVPSGSRVTGHLQAGDIRSTGQLGECRFDISAGNYSLEHTGPLRIDTSAGHITADSVAGDADISTGTGRIRVGAIDGAAVVKNSNGDTTIDAVTGDVRVRSANGAIQVEHAGAGVDAKTSNGAIRVGEVVQGSIVLATATGDLEIGVAGGTAAWLEVNTGFGRVRNLLTDAIRPEDTDRTVEVRARTSYGDITIHRS
ncbi:DUF4097 family beta strand repeat-containing protein [Nocardia sp. alder85J]|uniref:DUF4097 family beta strand repeat-containing protein n=1 Tax=Nocardia sp. alder85J TaxID=2862949 RepID=UPI001CD300F7|nr:DUF4097 family beta strand repeat-containing protein [Nocardia sp. alder85J]MCX4092317.1 DUF4097 family beta strand repeat-containing protein [Nocardia sp. alder85J]